MNKQVNPIWYDQVIAEMLQADDFEITQQPDGSYLLGGGEHEFYLEHGELRCNHANWETETDEVHRPEPYSDYETKYAWCPTCDEDVSDEVGFNDPPYVD